MSILKILSGGIAIAWIAAGAANAQNSQQVNVIENVVALQVAQGQCGTKINYGMLATVMNAVNIRPDDLVRGGKYYPSVERNQTRVRGLIATEAGKTSFCRTVRTELSAMLD